MPDHTDELRSQLLDLENAAWRSLTQQGEAARFYDENLARDVLMLFPGGMVIDDRQAVIDSMDAPPWASFEIIEPRVLPLSEDAAVLAYRVHAQREERDYEALLNSTYVRESGTWRLALHQQTPV